MPAPPSPQDVLTQKKGERLIAETLLNAGSTVAGTSSDWVEQTAAGAWSWWTIASSSDGTKLVSGLLGDYIRTSADGGATWTVRTASGQRIWSSIRMSSDGTYIVAGAGDLVTPGLIYYSRDGGVTWSSDGVTGSWMSVGISDSGQTMFAVARSPNAQTPLPNPRISRDGGVTWSDVIITGAQFQSCAISGDGTKLFACTEAGVTWYSTNSGTTWTAGGTGRTFAAMTSSVDGTKLVAIVNTTNTTVFRSVNYGVTWQALASGSSVWRDIAGSSDGSVLMASTNVGYLSLSTDSGTTWTQQTTAGSRGWTRVAVSSSGNLAAGIVYGGYLYTKQFILASSTSPTKVWYPSSAITLLTAARVLRARV